MPTPMVTTSPAVAASVLDAGGLAALPTETVYGLAADAAQPAAIARIFEVKGRPLGHPLILHVADPDLDRWHDRGWVRLDGAAGERARSLAAALWPGPLTIVMPRGPAVPDLVTGGRPTVALRVPAHPAARVVLELLGRPVAAPSANRFGRVSPTTAEHVVADIGALLDPQRDAILDGGSSVVGLESTIVELVDDDPQLLRPGAITLDDIEAIIDHRVEAAAGPARASGMLAAHYAPSCRVVVAEDAEAGAAIAARLTADGVSSSTLDLAGDAEYAARNLYASLRAADDDNVDTLIVVPPPRSGIGLAVRDRLQRAAAGSHRPMSDVDEPETIGPRRVRDPRNPGAISLP